jgi:hypothetical protein
MSNVDLDCALHRKLVLWAVKLLCWALRPTATPEHVHRASSYFWGQRDDS